VYLGSSQTHDRSRVQRVWYVVKLPPQMDQRICSFFFTVTQGGDWGGIVSNVLQVDLTYRWCILRSQGEWLLCMVGGITRHGTPTFQCVSFYRSAHTSTHSRLCSAVPPSWKTPLSFLSFLLTPWSIEEKAGIERTKWFRTKGMGYFTQQSTQPQTLGYSLADSPAGLLAWIYEKLVLWTDNYNWSDDEGSSNVVFWTLLTCFK
jgi:hypothetical protein